MRNAAQFLSMLAIIAVAACSENNALAPQNDPALDAASRGARPVSVMTRNLYIGADVDAAMAALGNADPSDDLPALMTALGTLQHTDFAARAQAVAHEIATNRPDVVGLQEVYDLTVIPALLGLEGDEIAIPFLDGLRLALAAEGVNYLVAARNTTTDATIAGGAVHIVDHDVVLVNADRVTLLADSVGAVYGTNIGQVAEGITLLRGYVTRRAVVGGVPTLLVNTHLESGEGTDFENLRAAQAYELAGVLGTEHRVILTGDFNGAPGTTMYQILTSAKLVDTWTALHPGAPGFTCCQAPDLSNQKSSLNQRIDFVWSRGFTGPTGRLDGQIQLISAQPSARVRGAFGLIWPSDHAGVVAELGLPVAASRN
jgi:endonuclease/exonuclease/phosphatase family metal-dependent hydrolase